MDASISESSAIVGQSNDQILAAIDQQAEAYSQFEPLAEKAASANQIAEKFNN